MCGIVYNLDFQNSPVNNRVLDTYYKQRDRGIDGFGVYDRANNKLLKSAKERKVLSYIKKHPSTEILFHHRYPTSTDNVTSACHPFMTGAHFKGANYIMVHNGVISNSRELKAEHDKLGIKYSSIQADGRFNDSEALLWDLALYLEGKQTELNAKGSIAFILIAKGKTDCLYFGRNHNPLNLKHREGIKLSLSSEGQGNPIAPDTLYKFDYASQAITETALTIPSNTYTSYTGNAGAYTTVYDAKAWADYDDDYTAPMSQPQLLASTDEKIIASDIKQRFTDYLTDWDGSYYLAYTQAENDMGFLYTSLKEAKLYDDDEMVLDCEYEIEVQKAVTAMLLDDDAWVDKTSRAVL